MNSEGHNSTPDITSPSTSHPVFSLVDSELSDISTREPRSPEFGALDEPGPPASPAPQISEAKLTPPQEEYPSYRQLATTSTTSFPPSPPSPPIPCQLRIPLSPLVSEHIRVSDVMLSELNSKLCAFPFLECLTQILQGLMRFLQPPRCTTTVEGDGDLSPRS